MPKLTHERALRLVYRDYSSKFSELSTFNNTSVFLQTFISLKCISLVGISSDFPENLNLNDIWITLVYRAPKLFDFEKRKSNKVRDAGPIYSSLVISYNWGSCACYKGNFWCVGRVSAKVLGRWIIEITEHLLNPVFEGVNTISKILNLENWRIFYKVFGKGSLLIGGVEHAASLETLFRGC